MDTTQTGVIASFTRGLGFAAVLYPRMKTDKPPVFTTLAEGKAVKVQNDVGTDYVFLSATQFSFKEGDVSFEGTVGAVTYRGDRVVLSLGAAGSITANGQSLKANKAATKQFKLHR